MQNIKRKGVIYRMVSPSGKVYIGQSYNVSDRIYRYKKLKCSRQPNIFNSLKKYGFSAHSFTIITEGEYYSCHLDQLEREYISYYNSVDVGLNVMYGGNLHSKHGHETILKMKAAAMNRSAEHRLAISNQNRSRIISEGTRVKMSIAKKGTKLTEEHVRKMKLNHRNNTAKIVLDTNTGIYYNSGAEASKAKNMNHNTLKNMLNGSKRNKTSLIYA